MPEEANENNQSLATTLSGCVSLVANLSNIIILVSAILLAGLVAITGRNWSEFLAYTLAILIVSVGIVLLWVSLRQKEKEDRAKTSFPKGAAFRGPVPFEKGDSEKFYGRGIEVGLLFDKIKADNFRYGVFFGESGCGKTSLLNAGLIPKLQKEDYLPVYVRLKLNETPEKAIRQAVETISKIKPQSKELVVYLRIVTSQTRKTLVLLCDQFEELFIHFSEVTRESFISFVGECYHDEILPIKFLFTLKTEFVPRMFDFHVCIPEPLATDNTFELENFKEPQAIEIVERSLREANISFEPSLIAQVTQDLLIADRKILPTELQIVCYRLQNKRIFSLEEYRHIGGKESLVDGYLEDLMKFSRNKDVARKILNKLVGKNDTKSPLTLSEISHQTGISTEMVTPVLDIFVKTGLVRKIKEPEPAEEKVIDKYELAHEYLIKLIHQRTTGQKLWDEIASTPLWRPKFAAIFSFLKFELSQGFDRIPRSVRTSMAYGGLALSIILVLFLAKTTLFQIGANWTQVSLPRGDIITALTYSPSQTGKLFATACNGRTGCSVFFSEDDGETWHLLTAGATSAFVRSLSVSPFNESTMWAATEVDGILISNDGGRTWKPSSLGLGSFVVNKVQADHKTPGLLYAATDTVGSKGGLYYSLDDGRAWRSFNRNLSSFSISDFSLAKDGSLFVAVPGQGIFRCGADIGSECEHIVKGLSALDITQVRFDSKNEIVYASSSSSGLFKSVDLGNNWEELSVPQRKIKYIVTDATGKLYIVTEGSGGHLLWSSVDQGNSWQRTGTGWLYSHVEVIMTDPAPKNSVFVGTPTGILKSTDGADSWTFYSVGVEPVDVRAVAVADTLDGPIYIGTTTGTVFRSYDKGNSWELASNGLDAQELRYLFVNPEDPDTVYAGTYRPNLTQSLFRTQDGGNNWIGVDVGNDDTGIITIDYDNPGRLYATTYGSGVITSKDGGLTWNGPAKPMTDPYTTAIANSLQNSETLFAGTSTGVLYKSTDGSHNWQEIVSQLPPIRDIVISRHNDDLVYIGSRRGLFIIENQAGSWTTNNILETASIRVLIADPCNSTGLFAGTQEGTLYWITDKGNHWVLVNSDLVLGTVLSLATFRECTHSLYLGSSSKGLLFLDYRRLWDRITFK